MLREVEESFNVNQLWVVQDRLIRKHGSDCIVHSGPLLKQHHH